MSLAFCILNIFCSIGWKQYKKRWPLAQRATLPSVREKQNKMKEKELGRRDFPVDIRKNNGFLQGKECKETISFGRKKFSEGLKEP